MKKMYLITVILIAVITFAFLFFYCDESQICIRFLKSYGYETENKPISSEAYLIPDEFDDVIHNYNLMQLSSGFDLYAYKGRNANKYTYKITNLTHLPFPVYANVICVNGEIAAADLVNPKIDGFILPMLHISDLMKNHIPAKNDAVIP